jgi:hypothetical protein
MGATEHSEWIAHEKEPPRTPRHTSSHFAIVHRCVVETTAKNSVKFLLDPSTIM